MKIVTFADLHLSNSNSYGHIGQFGFNSVLNKQYKEVERLLSLERIDATLFAGDLSDKPIIDPKVGAIISGIFDRGRNIVWMCGNHDTDDSIGYTNVLGNYGFASDIKKQIHFVNRAQVIELNNNLVVFCHPWVDSDEHFKHICNDIKSISSKKYTKIFLGHLSVRGAEWDGGICYEGINPNLFIKYRKVFKFFVLGHFHKFQRIKANPNAFYCGALTHRNFKYANIPMGYQIIDTETMDIDHIKTSLLDFRQFHISEDDHLPKLLSRPEKYKSIIPNLYLRIKYSGKDIEMINGVKNKLVDLGVSYIRIDCERRVKTSKTKKHTVAPVNLQSVITKVVRENYSGLQKKKAIESGMRYLEI